MMQVLPMNKYKKKITQYETKEIYGFINPSLDWLFDFVWTFGMNKLPSPYMALDV